MEMSGWDTSPVLKELLACMCDSQGDADVLDDKLTNATVDINAYDSKGYTLLHHAARLGYDDSIYVLFKHGADLNILSIDNKTAAAIANESGFSNTADFLTSLSSEESSFLDAIKSNNIDYIKANVKNPDCKYYRTKCGLFPLHYACEVGAIHIVMELLKNGFNINEADAFGRTPLHWSAIMYDWDLLTLLLQNGADYHIPSLTGKTAICMAFPFLKKYNQPDFSAMCDEAFYDAIKRLDIESCESFIDCRPPHYLDKLVDSNGNTALHIAVQDWEGIGVDDVALQVELVELFLSMQLDPLKPNKQGHSSFDLAKASPHPEIVILFDSYLPSPSLPDCRISIESSTASLPLPPSGRPSFVDISTEIVEAEQEGETNETNAQQLSLTASSSIDELLQKTGMLEYSELFKEKHYMMCSDLFSLSEADWKDLKLKFGHRKRLMDIIHRMDYLDTILEASNLVDHKKQLLDLGFDSIWSLLGVKKEYADKMGLSEDEMNAFLREQEKLEVPPLPALGGNDSCEPLLQLIFDEENTQRIMTQEAITTVDYFLYIDMNAQEELAIKFGENVGLCYLVSVSHFILHNR